LYNIQQYFENSTYLPSHFDGEYFDFQKNKDDSLVIKKAIRPNYVSVLTLVNFATKGGTKIMNPNNEKEFEILQCGVGDIATFRNDKVMHGAEPFIMR